MGKVLAWVAIAAIVWFAWRFLGPQRRRAQASRRDGAATGGAGGEGGAGGDAEASGDRPRRVDAPERMLRCAVCGVHLPGSEARFAGGRVYCSDAHRDQAAAGVGAERDERR